MDQAEREKQYCPDDARAEYQAVADYHSSIVSSRFTIAGLYVAAVGIVAAAVFNADTNWWARLAGSFLAMWLTLCLWILELRSRALFTNLAHRGIQIEHDYWHLKGDHWYDGFFSRMYKEPPGFDPDAPQQLPRRIGPDRPRIAWSARPMSVRLSKFVSHSMGLDLLYGGGMVFWAVLLVVSAISLICPSPPPSTP